MADRSGHLFDRTASGDSLILGLEAAHSRRRIVHADGDRTGKRVLDALIHAVRRASSIQVLENHCVMDLALDGRRPVVGVFCAPGDRRAAMNLS